MCLAIPSKVLSLAGSVGKVDIGGVVREISFSLMQNISVGEYVLVHAGYAIEKINETEALETIELLRSVCDIEAAEREERFREPLES